MPQPFTIAVIDDEDVVRAAMASLLRSLGLKVETFPSADAFLAAPRRGFDCLISDVQMPGVDGLELQRRLAALPDPAPVIIMTAYPERTRAAAMAQGAAGFMEKPVDADRLITCLETVLGPIG